jgi:hypothetical protein
MRCAECGLEMRRDEVPTAWAAKRCDELLQIAKSQSPSFSALYRILINPAVPAVS